MHISCIYDILSPVQTAGCDLVLGSTQVVDRCDECGGDGSTCSDTIDLDKNPLVMAKSINNEEIRQKLAVLEESKCKIKLQSCAKINGKTTSLPESSISYVHGNC